MSRGDRTLALATLAFIITAATVLTTADEPNLGARAGFAVLAGVAGAIIGALVGQVWAVIEWLWRRY